jgi:uncharacterized protein (DUF2225 family)
MIILFFFANVLQAQGENKEERNESYEKLDRKMEGGWLSLEKQSFIVKSDGDRRKGRLRLR